jgi:hypothetical protein
MLPSNPVLQSTKSQCVRYTTPDDCICSCLTIESILLNKRTTQRRVDVPGVYPTPNTTSMRRPRLFLRRDLDTPRSVRSGPHKDLEGKNNRVNLKHPENSDAGSRTPDSELEFFTQPNESSYVPYTTEYLLGLCVCLGMS